MPSRREPSRSSSRGGRSSQNRQDEQRGRARNERNERNEPRRRSSFEQQRWTSDYPRNSGRNRYQRDSYDRSEPSSQRREYDEYADFPRGSREMRSRGYFDEGRGGRFESERYRETNRPPRENYSLQGDDDTDREFQRGRGRGQFGDLGYEDDRDRWSEGMGSYDSGRFQTRPGDWQRNAYGGEDMRSAREMQYTGRRRDDDDDDDSERYGRTEWRGGDRASDRGSEYDTGEWNRSRGRYDRSRDQPLDW